MTENRPSDAHVLDDVVASVTTRLLEDEAEAKLVAKLMKKVMHGGASVEDVTRHRSFEAANLEDLIQAARTEFQRRKSEIVQAGASGPQNTECRDDAVLIDTENQPATRTHVSPSPRMKKLLAAKRRSNSAATTRPGPDRDANVQEKILSPDPLESLEHGPVPPVLKHLEKENRGQSQSDDADCTVHRTAAAGKGNAIEVAAKENAIDVSSGTSDVASHHEQAMEEELMKEYGFREIYVYVERNLPELVEDANALVNDDLQKDDDVDEDFPEHKDNAGDHSTSSNETAVAHSETGLQTSASAPPAMPLKYTTNAAAGTYTCDYCQQVFCGLEDVAEHYIVVHAPTGSAYRCEMCGAQCKSQESLARHMRHKHKTAVRQMKKINVPRYEAFAADLPAFEAWKTSKN